MTVDAGLGGPHGWVGRALCARVAPGAEWVNDRHPDPELSRLCGLCPVRVDCARHALALNTGPGQVVGTWAGVHLPVAGSRRPALAALAQVAAFPGRGS